MDLIAKNLEDNDCMIVAAYNALLLSGKQADYKHIEFLAMANAWYDPEIGFKSTHIEDLMRGLKIGKEVTKGTTTIDIKEKVKSGVPHILLCKHVKNGDGHAMIAVKGEKGVRIINPTNTFKGWRTICRLFNSGLIALCAYEISL